MLLCMVKCFARQLTTATNMRRDTWPEKRCYSHSTGGKTLQPSLVINVVGLMSPYERQYWSECSSRPKARRLELRYPSVLDITELPHMSQSRAVAMFITVKLQNMSKYLCVCKLRRNSL